MVNAARMDQQILVYVLLGGLAIGLLISIYTDIRYRLILNGVTAPIALAAPPYWYAVGDFNWTAIGIHLLIAFIVFAFFALLFRFGGMGGGDVKLFSALALWFDFTWVMRLLLVASLLGALVTIIFWGIHKARRQSGQPRIPYGVAISLAGLWVAGEQIFNHFG
jgi:prepilin peptidase CpaA